MTASSETAELLQRGIAAARAGRKVEASRLLMQVVERDEHNEQAWLWLSGVVDSLDDRRVCLENVLALNPNHSAALAGLRHLDQAAAAEARSRVPPPPSGAQPAAPAAGELCPFCLKPLPATGTKCPQCGGPLLVVCPACGEYADVQQPLCATCGQSIGDYRQGAAYFLSLAQASLARGRHEATLQALGHAESRAGDDAPTLGEIAALYEQLGRLDLAAQAAERAAAAAPQSAAAYARLSSIYQQQGQIRPAQAAMRKAAELSADPAVQLELARLYLDEDGTVTEAVALLGQMIKAKPMNAQAHLLLGDAYRKQGNEDRARRSYQDAARLAPADSQAGIEARSRLAIYEPAPPSAMGGRAARRQGERPGCVTLYAVWLAISGSMSALGALILVAFGSAVFSRLAMERDPLPSGVGQGILWAAAGITLVFALAYLVLAYGLWTMKNWARINVLVLSILGLLATIGQAVVSLTGMEQLAAQTSAPQMSTFFLCAIIPEFAISGYIIFWFWANRELFS